MAGILTAPARSEAGSYTVHVCDAASGNRVNAISFGQNGLNTAINACPTDDSGHRIGFGARSGLNNGTTPFLTSAWAVFNAPPGTSIDSVSGHIAGRGVQGFGTSFQSSTDHFATQTTVLTDCTLSFCAMAGPDGGIPVTYWTPGATALRLLVICSLGGGCSTNSSGGWPYAPGWATMGDMQVSVNDPTPPSLGNSRGSGWDGARWHHGVNTIGFDASDTTGIQRMRVLIDGGDASPSIDQGYGCDYANTVPCPNPSFDSSFDTARLADGNHTIRLAAANASGDWSSTAVGRLDVDNHAPSAPSGVTVTGGEDAWHTTNSFDLSWTNPGGQAAPIAKAHYTLYDGTGAAVASGTREGSGITSITGVSVPAQGDYTLKLYLEDAAGNTNPGLAADAVHLKFDDAAPGQANPERRNGWVSRDRAADYVQQVKRPLSNSEIPVSGIDGYAYTTDGSEPGSASQVKADAANEYQAEAHLGGLQQGTTEFRVRAISGAGIPSSRIGIESIHADLTAPELSLAGEPATGEWTRNPLSLQISATDPGHLSGMAGAEPSDIRDENGAYVTFSVDSASSTIIRGPSQPLDPNGLRGFSSTASALAAVDGDGRHTVTYSATDVAGNESERKTVVVKIDRTAPELVVFEPQRSDDPRLINVAAADATSGLADGGKIQLRRVNGGDWITLRTSREGSRYYAHVDNSQIPEGDYEFRATVPDQAGNVATGDRNRAGAKEILHIDPTHVGPYRTDIDRGGIEAADQGATVPTTLTAGISSPRTTTVKKCRKTRSKRGKRRRKCRTVSVTRGQRLVRAVRIAYGKRPLIKGALTTGDGHAVPNVEITVLSQAASDGSRLQAETSIRTDRNGAFTYRAPVGPSRAIDFAYRGDSTYKHTDGFVNLSVLASATIRASRKRVRNGASVLFRGVLRGRPFPTKGKILDLQAFYRHKWRTFATPRASLRGKWKYRYRFGATHGIVIYRFRVRVRASSDYPYELGYSKKVTVKVTGR